MNFVLLTATLLALLSGPLLYAAARARPSLLAFLDGFVLVAIGGLVLMEVLPDALAVGGWWSLGFLALGALGPTLLENRLHHAREAHVAALVLAIAGLVLHSIGDGAALAPAAEHAAEAVTELGHHHDHAAQGGLALPLAIVVHSVPVGLVVWWLLFPVFGARLPALALLAMCVGTVGGYAFGPALNGVLGATAWAWFQAVIAGSILHVVFGRPHLDETSEHRGARPPFEGLGNLAALAGLVALETLHLPGYEHHPFLDRLLALALYIAPALLAAHLIGGFFGRQQAGAWLERLLQAAPAAAGLRRAVGLALTEAGLITLLLSLRLLGVELTALWLGSALLLSLVLGLAMRLAPAAVPVFRLEVPAAAADDCEHAHHHHHHHRRAPRVVRPPSPPGLRRAAIDSVDASAPWIIAGVALAAIAAAWAQPVPWAGLPGEFEVLIFALLSVPFYLASAGLVPLVTVLLAGALSPGAALALLLTGPALSHAGLTTAYARHGRVFAAALTVVAVSLAVILGIAVNRLPLPPILGVPQLAELGPVQTVSLGILLLLYAASLLRRGGRQLFGELLEPVR